MEKGLHLSYNKVKRITSTRRLNFKSIHFPLLFSIGKLQHKKKKKKIHIKIEQEKKYCKIKWAGKEKKRNKTQTGHNIEQDRNGEKKASARTYSG